MTRYSHSFSAPFFSARLLSLFFGLTVLLLPRVAFAQYSITDLGVVPGGHFSSANGVNASGQATGNATPSSGNANAFLYSAGTLTDINPAGSTSSIGNGLNNAGQVIGYAEFSGGSAHVFYYDGTAHDLGTLGGSVGTGYGINSLDQITGGSAITGDTASHAFLSTTAVTLTAGNDITPTLGAGLNSAGYGINSAGQVVGFEQVSAGTPHAFVYTGGTVTDLGTLGGSTSIANGINDAGVVVGQADTSGGATHAFIHSGLGTLGAGDDIGVLSGFDDSYGYSINSLGNVVGDLENSGTTTYNAFLYQGGTLFNLNSLISGGSGWILDDAFGINNAGQIVGDGVIGGETHAFLLTPTTATPEPDARIVFGLGVLLLGSRVLLRRRKSAS